MASAHFPPGTDSPPLPAVLPLAQAASGAGVRTDISEVRWADIPALPDAVLRAVADAWRVRMVADAAAPAALAHPSVAAVVHHARAEQIARALSHRTNLVLPGSRVVIVGDGGLAAALTDLIRRAGGRVVRATADAPTALRARLAGLETHDVDPGDWPPADTVLAVGTGHAPLDPAAVTGVVMDASPDARGILPIEGSPVRAHVVRVGDGTWIVDAPPLFPAEPAAATTLEWHIADAFLALSLLAAADPATSAAQLDDRFARLVLA